MPASRCSSLGGGRTEGARERLEGSGVTLGACTAGICTAGICTEGARGMTAPKRSPLWLREGGAPKTFTGGAPGSVGARGVSGSGVGAAAGGGDGAAGDGAAGDCGIGHPPAADSRGERIGTAAVRACAMGLGPPCREPAGPAGGGTDRLGRLVVPSAHSTASNPTSFSSVLMTRSVSRLVRSAMSATVAFPSTRESTKPSSGDKGSVRTFTLAFSRGILFRGSSTG
jgi:hypothetical protein